MLYPRTRKGNQTYQRRRAQDDHHEWKCYLLCVLRSVFCAVYSEFVLCALRPVLCDPTSVPFVFRFVP